jgi:2-succinyl-5-enolpyruvyl-6-hydroxy-3-cyclohexene-1-carboxylate synthase
MPVRDVESFAAPRGGLRIASNRGVNGIDGFVSTVLGIAAAADGDPTVALCGDLCFLHDSNGLIGVADRGLDATFVVVDNNGGGIFSFLPQAEAEVGTFEELFGTPHGLDFRPFVEGYGGRFVRIDGRREFAAAVCDGLARGGLHVVEVPTDRARNVGQHRRVWRLVADALSPASVC